MKLKLKRPLVFFDLEATGLNVASDRIVEYSFIKVFPEGKTEEKKGRINPQIPIPLESSLIHGIYDQDVVHEPTFDKVAADIDSFLKNADIAGYNSNKFDIPLLAEEMLRAGFDFDLNNTKTIDVQVIFHKMEQRTLAAAYKFYCKKELQNAHQASADIQATLEILETQLDVYGNLENSVDFLSQFTTSETSVDFAGRIIKNEKGVEIFNFGKHKGKTVEEVLEKEPSYYAWMMQGEFPFYTKKALKEIKEKIQVKKLAGKFNASPL